jgi:hypothetical protein
MGKRDQTEDGKARPHWPVARGQITAGAISIIDTSSHNALLDRARRNEIDDEIEQITAAATTTTVP